MNWNLAMLNMRHWGQPSWLRWVPRSALRTRLTRIWPPMVSNRNFFLAEQFKRNADIRRILFVDQPPMDFRRALKTIVGGGLDRLTPDAKRRTAMAESVLPAISRSWWLKRMRYHLDRLKMNDHLLLWSYHPLFPEWLERMSATVKVFDAVDDWTTHPQYQHRKEELELAYERISSAADIIFTVSEALKRQRFSHHPHCVWVPNGVDLDLFRHPKPWPCPELDRISPPVIGYVGVIQNRLDVELLHRVIAKHPDKNFVFVGSVWPDSKIDLLRSFANVKILGAVPFEAVPSMLQRFHVAMLPHRKNALTSSMNPLKIYEYLAAGLPIVSTRVEGLQPFENDIRIAETPEAFAAEIDEALRMDCAEARQRRRHLVEAHTWEKRMNTMLRHIEMVAKEKSRTHGNDASTGGVWRKGSMS